MKQVLSFILVLCCILTLYTWVFETDNVSSVSVGTVAVIDSNGNKKDSNGYIIPEYYDTQMSGEFYEAGKKPLAFINDVGTAFDNMRDGVTSVISSSTKVTSTIVDTLTGIFNFDDVHSWWDDIFYSVSDGGSRGSR